MFVTHDIDEAIKMGDRIAILGERSVIKQLDTPERILAYPVDDFVDDFIGSGSTLKGLNFERVADLDLGGYPTITTKTSHADARRILEDTYQRWILVLDDQGRPLRWADEHVLANDNVPIGESGPRVVAKVEQNATLHDTLEQMLVSSAGVCCVVDSKTDQLVGVVEIETLNSVISGMRQSAKKHYDDLAAKGVAT